MGRGMLVVALLGLALGFPIGVLHLIENRWVMGELHAAAYRDAASKHRSQAAAFGLESPGTERLRRLAAHHLVMYHKWTSAARSPWSSVRPDPPAPD